jgi:hypothetical protein
MDRENHISTKPADRGMIKELCRYLDRFWRPEGEAPDEAPHIPDMLYDVESYEEERRRYALCGKPPKKDHLLPAVGVGLGSFLSSLKSRLNKAEETCSERLLRLIRERGRNEVEVYQKAGVDRKLFSKMRRKDYRPKAKTLYAFIIVLQLTLDDAVDLLASAGYAFSSASRLDLAVKFCVEKGIGNLDEVNNALYELGMETLP